jgi:hypothetical protein
MYATIRQRVRRMTMWWTFRRPCMGRPVPRQLLRNALRNLTTIVPATAYHRRRYAEKYSRGIAVCRKVTLMAMSTRRPRRGPRLCRR